MLILLALLAYTHRSISVEITKSKIAREAARKTTTLIVVTSDFLEHHYDREEEQWRVTYGSINSLIQNNPDITALQPVSSELNILHHHFTRIVEVVRAVEEMHNLTHKREELKKLLNLKYVVSSQIDLASQKILGLVLNISYEADRNIDRIQKINILIIIVFTLAAIIVIYVNSYATAKKIIRPLADLVQGARMIEKGKLDHRIINSENRSKTESNDELKQLTHAFNTMAERLDEQVWDLLSEVREHEITEKKLQESLLEKELLLKEIHHRVKNNMQIISSLLNLQSEKIIDERDRDLFMESRNRVYSMALIHEMLYRSESIREIDFTTFIEAIISELKKTYIVNPDKITFNLSSANFFVEINNAIPCALIINELISNSMKHAFPGDRKGTISIDLRLNQDGLHVIEYHDNGKGIEHEIDLKKSKTLGLQLVSSLVTQLRGTVTIDNNNGTRFTIVF